MTKKRASRKIVKKGFAYCLFHWSDGGIYLMLAQDQDAVIVRGWSGLIQALHFFEQAQQNGILLNFRRGSETLIDWRTYQPSICWAESAEWLQQHVIADTQQIFLLGKSESQKLVGETKPGALALWLQGEKPKFQSFEERPDGDE